MKHLYNVISYSSLNEIDLFRLIWKEYGLCESESFRIVHIKWFKLCEKEQYRITL